MLKIKLFVQTGQCIENFINFALEWTHISICVITYETNQIRIYIIRTLYYIIVADNNNGISKRGVDPN